MAASKAIGFLNFKFGADLSGFERAMNKAQKKLKKFGKNVTKAGQNLSRNLTLPILALGAASIKAFDEQAKAETKLLTALKGREDVQQRLIAQAKELQKTTLFGDEATIESQALLASLGLTEEQIVMLMPQIQNMATALGMDLTAATSLVSKSVSTSTDALARYFDTGLKGVNGQQERAIVLTTALTEKFEGQAEAAAKVGAGPLIMMKNQLGDLGEELGQRLMPYVKKFIDFMVGLIGKFDGLSESTKDNIVKWGLILAAIGPVLIIIGKLSIGIGALIGGLKGLATWLVANPYIVLAAAITGVVFALGNWIEKAWGVSDAQRSINEVMDAANKAILTQQTEVKILTGVLKHENSTLEAKETALNKLKEIAPEYYGKLNAAKLDVIALDTATKNYTESIQKQALAEAGRAKLVDLSKELIDLQSKQKNEVQKFTEVLSKLGTEEYNLGILNRATEKSMDSRIASVKQEIDAITNLVVANEQLGESQNKVNKSGFYGSLLKLTEKFTLPTPTSTTSSTTTPTSSTEKKVEQMEALSLATHDAFEEIHLLSHRLEGLEMPEGLFNTDPMDKYRGALGMLGEEIAAFVGTDIKSMEEGLASIMERMGDELSQGADTFQEYADNVKGMIKDVIGALISQGVAAAVSKSLISAGIINPFLIPVVAGLAAGLARTAFNSLIPSFADGGIISGPTVGLMGEYPGASSNPEVIAPLDKLKSMMGGGNQNIVVEGVLKGNDIYLSNRNTSINRLRTT